MPNAKTRRWIVSLLILALTITLSGCNSAQAPHPTPGEENLTPLVPPTAIPASPETSTEPAPTEEPAASTGDNVAIRQQFEQSVMRAVVERDFEAMPALMSDPFTISGWQAGGAQWTPAEAVAQLQATFYPPEGSTVSFGGPQPDLSALLGQNPADFFGGGVSFLYSVGWGAAGNGEAILVIDATEEGVLCWRSILIATSGF